VRLSEATGWRIQRPSCLPGDKKTQRGRRRPDPLADIFANDVVPMLKEGNETYHMIHHATHSPFIPKPPDVDDGDD